MPLPQQPVVFMEVGFLAALCREMAKPFDEIALPDNITFLKELIFKRSTVYVNLTPETIIQIAAADWRDDSALPPEYKTAFPYLKKLMADGPFLRSWFPEVDTYKSADTEAIKRLGVKPNFLLLNDSPETCIDLQNKLGVICISGNFKTEEYNIRFGFEPIDRLTSYDVNGFAAKVSQGNCLVIEDPYFATNHCRFPDFVPKLLMALSGLELETIPFPVLLVVKNDPDKTAEFETLTNFANLINQELGDAIRVNVWKTRQRMHDRHIYSNTYWISCEGGFQEKYNSPTKWNFHPLGLYYSGYQNRLQEISNWVKAGRAPHPLL